MDEEAEDEDEDEDEEEEQASAVSTVLPKLLNCFLTVWMENTWLC